MVTHYLQCEWFHSKHSFHSLPKTPYCHASFASIGDITSFLSTSGDALQ